MFKYAKKTVANTASKIKGAAAKQADDLEGIDPTTYARRWWILGALCLTLLGVMLANSSMNMALPKMAIDLNLAQLDLTWIVNAYTLVFASLLFISVQSAIAMDARLRCSVDWRFLSQGRCTRAFWRKAVLN